MHPSNKLLVHRSLATAANCHELHGIAAEGGIEIARSNAGVARVIEDLIVLLDACPPKQIVWKSVTSGSFKCCSAEQLHLGGKGRDALSIDEVKRYYVERGCSDVDEDMSAISGKRLVGVA